LSGDEIAERLALPKTTVYYWISDLPLPRARSNRGQRLGTVAMQAKYRYSIQYHADQDLEVLCAYWADVLAIDGSSIRLLRKSNSNQLKARTWRSARGVLTVGVNDTYLRARLQSWIDRIREDWRLDSCASVGA
jgi:hypothetical protein